MKNGRIIDLVLLSFTAPLALWWNKTAVGRFYCVGVVWTLVFCIGLVWTLVFRVSARSRPKKSSKLGHGCRGNKKQGAGVKVHVQAFIHLYAYVRT